jgi:hypothetical protein
MARERLNSDTAAWNFQVWAAFAISLSSMAAGVFYLDVPDWTRAFLGLGLFFTVSSCFALAKTVRDRHESDKLLGRIEEARTEAVLRDFGREAA